MERKVTIILLVAAVAFIGGGCKRERINLPPNAPVVSGPDSAQVMKNVTFRASATDPNGDNVAIRFD